MLELIIVTAVITVLAALAAPAFMHSRAKTLSTHCLNSLRQLSSAIDQYMLQNANAVPALTDLDPEFIRHLRSCPGGGAYTILPTGEPVCSLSGSGHTI